MKIENQSNTAYSPNVDISIEEPINDRMFRLSKIDHKWER